MNSERQLKRLERVLTFSNGRTSPERNENHHIPVFGANGLIGTTHETNSPSNTIIVGRVGSYCGSVHFSHKPCWVTDNAIKATAKDNNDPLFLFYLLKHLNLNNWRSGSGQPLINQTILNSIEAPIPAPKEQRALSRLIGTLDDRITLLRETNKTLESIAQAIFKSWFVDFDQVRAKMEGRQPEGMDEETAALFPDSFEESELGLLPRGWRIGCLNDLSTLNPESWTAKKHPQVLIYVDLANTKENVISETSVFSFDDAPSRARRVLRTGDSIIGTVRPGNKSFAFIQTELENLTGSTGFAVLRPLATESAEFIYLSATQESAIEYLAHVADGGAYPAVRPEVVSQIKSCLPPEKVLENFHSVISPLFKSIAHNQLRIAAISTIRDTLLPRLISGQLRLPEAQEQVEDALS